MDSVNEYGHEILASVSTISDVSNNNIPSGYYALLPDTETDGQSKLVLVAQGENGDWSPAGESQTVISVLDSTISSFTAMEGQSYYSVTPEGDVVPPNILHLQGDIDSIAGYKLSVPSGSTVEYLRQEGSITNELQPNDTLNGSDHYLCPSLHATPHQRQLLWQFQFAV